MSARAKREISALGIRETTRPRLSSRIQGVTAALGKPGRGEIIALFLVLIFPVMGTFFAPESYFAPQDFTIEGISDREVGFPFGRIAFVFLIMWEIYLFWKMPKTFGRALMRAFLPIMFELWSTITGVWSLDPSQSMNRSIRTLIIVVFAAYFMERFSPKQALQAITISGGVLIIASVAAVVLMPQYGLTHLVGYEGAWRGATGHKNALAGVMVFVFLFAMFAAKYKALNLKLATLVAFSSLLLIGLAKSATSVFMITIILFLITAISFTTRFKSTHERVFIGILALIGILVLFMLQDFLGSLLFEVSGRDATLTGRTEIWGVVWEMIQLRPWWGYGSGFWAIDSPDRAYVWGRLGYAPPHAHNTYLDAWLQLGIPGLLLLLTIELVACWRIGLLVLRRPFGLSIVWAILILVIIIKGFVEQALIGAISSDTFWLTIAYLGINQAMRTGRGNT